MQDNSTQGVNFDEGIERMPSSNNGSQQEQYLSPEEAQRQAGFDSLAETTTFAGDKDESYSEAQLNGENDESSNAFNAVNEIDEEDPVVNEDEMNEEDFADAELDNTRETLGEALDYENANYGRPIVTRSLKDLSSLANRITRAGIITPDQESEPGKLETQCNNLCKAACIYALYTKQLADNAIIRFSFSKDAEAANHELAEVEKYSSLTEESAAMANEQVKAIDDPVLREHIYKRLDQALEMTEDARQRLKETIESGQPQIDEDQITEDALVEDDIDEDNIPRAISSIAARVDNYMEQDENEQGQSEVPEVAEADQSTAAEGDESQPDELPNHLGLPETPAESDELPNHLGLPAEPEAVDELPNHLGLRPDAAPVDSPADDSYGGFLPINQEPAETASKIDAASDNINNPNYYSDMQGGEQGEF